MTLSSSEPPGHFNRSYSTPELGSKGNPTNRRPSGSDNKPYLDKDLSDITSFDVPTFNSDFELDTTLFIPETEEDKPQQPSKLRLSIPSSSSSSNSKNASTSDRRKSWLGGFKSSKDDAPKESKPLLTSKSDHALSLRPPEAKPKDRGISPTESFANFARRGWISRTPSPKNQSPVDPKVKPEQKFKFTRLQPKHEKADAEPKATPVASENQKAPSKAPSRAGNYFAKMKSKQPQQQPQLQPQQPQQLQQPQQPQPAQLSSAQDDANSDTSSATSVQHEGPRSITSRTSQSTSSESNSTPITDDSSNEMPPQVRDTLWSSFKTLELEFKGFTLKQMAQRIIQVQSLLLPFLRSTMKHPSIKALQPEDVDRRATILHKWWNAILDLLDGQSQQPVPGVDRPILLEAATMLMMRPEWRRTTSSFQPLADRSPSERVRSRSWANSSQSTFDSHQSMMLAESAEHNVRTMFISNLVRQMAIVVDKMSLRHAPLTLVNFAGKTCAYAFFFAPGVADILLRLWGLTPELIRRVADEFGLPRKDNGDSDDIISFFPSKLGSYGWTSPRAVWNNLKQIPKMTVLVARIPWTGPWVARWKGRDTDLFFIFCKYFYILSDQFMPPGLPISEQARAPAFVLVQAQLLSLLDSTIHRQAALGQAHNPPLVDSTHGADASAFPMQLPPSNLLKGMSENRLVVLLKDFLIDDASEIRGAKETFASVFAALIKAATRRTSKFNNTACFTLCDFLEEVFVIYDDFTSSESASSYIDWTFWIEVFRRIMSSMNTMSEVRTLAFLFTVWNVAAKDPRAKTELCADWLLTEETFNSLFNNWCPMVRAYYHRLLCWRMCRYDGKVNDADAAVYRLVMARLKTVWGHYLYQKQQAEIWNKIAPSTAPMTPTVGKRFIIIRQEVNAPQPGLFMGFDSFAKTPTSSEQSDGYFDSAALPRGESKKRWSLLGKVLSLTSGTSEATNQAALPRNHSFEDSLHLARREVSEHRSRPLSQGPIQTQKLVSAGVSSAASDDGSRASSPVPEGPKYVFKFTLSWQQQNHPSRERHLFTPQLPGPAQDRIGGKSVGVSRPQLAEGLRSVSGSSQPGLVQRAKNASPIASPKEERLRRLSLGELVSTEGELDGDNAEMVAASISDESDATRTATPNGYLFEDTTQPTKPAGAFVRNVVYSGPSLAEWAQVVSEHNCFVDRRRDEGVTRMCDMEVPVLNVEGFRKLGG